MRGPVSALSYVNEPRSAPICQYIACFPPPAGCRHNIEVVDLQLRSQLLVAHCVAPMEIVEDVSAGPKLMPDSESVAPPVVGPFGALTSVNTGAANQSRVSQ